MNIYQELALRDELMKPAYAANLAAHAYATIATTLNAQASIANPVPQPSRPKLLTWTVFMDLLTAADVLKLYGYNNLSSDLKAALETNNRTITLAIWRGLKTALTAGSITAVETEAAKTELDPNWKATVLAPSIAMGLGLPTVAADDAQLAHHRMGA